MQTSDQYPHSQFDIWTSLLSEKAAAVAPPISRRRPSSPMSQESLEICTESLGSETGSDGYFSSSSSADDELDSRNGGHGEEEEEDEGVSEEGGVAEGGALRRREGKELMAVNYHCAVGRRSPPPVRSFPPPLTSIARRDAPCIHLRPHRRDGRLVVEAVAVPPVNYLHARRADGRLVLSFIDAVIAGDSASREMSSKRLEEENYSCEEEEELEVEEEEEEEVEVVDRGIVIEVKVSTQPQLQSGAAAVKVHRSSVVINKFVGGTPLSCPIQCQQAADHTDSEALRRVSPAAATTAPTAATVVVASTLGAAPEGYAGGLWTPPDNKQLLLITSKRRNREELLHDMRRCSELRRPLFIWEPCCIVTSSS